MGYITDYNGTIELSDKKIIGKLNDLFKKVEKTEQYFGIEGITFYPQQIDISGYGKMYDNKLERFCLFIAKIDKKSLGQIICKGEESDDLWRINICGGGVNIQQGSIVYDENNVDNFSSNKINKDIYKITKDKELLKEIILEELEK